MDTVNELMSFRATAVAGSDVNLALDIDAATLGVKSDSANTRTLVGVAGKCGTTTGWIVAKCGGVPVASFDLVALSALSGPWDLTVPVPAGGLLSFYVHALVGTDICVLTAFIKRG